LLALSDDGGGLQRIEIKVAEAPAPRPLRGTLDVSRAVGSFGDLEVNAGDVVDINASGEYRVGGQLTTGSGLGPSSFNFSDEPYRSGSHGAPFVIAGKGGRFVGALLAPCAHMLARSSGGLAVGINDRARRGNSGDLLFFGEVRPATAQEWETGQVAGACLPVSGGGGGPGALASPWVYAAARAVHEVFNANGPGIADAVQRITHPTGSRATMTGVRIDPEGSTAAVRFDVAWGGLLRTHFVTQVLWEFDERRHIQAVVTGDTAPVHPSKADTARLNQFLADKILPRVRERTFAGPPAQAYSLPPPYYGQPPPPPQ
jgi:hypothetical protein